MEDEQIRTSPAAAGADVSVVQQAAAPFPLFVGQTITYTITVTNPSLSQAGDVLVSDPMPLMLNDTSAVTTSVIGKP